MPPNRLGRKATPSKKNGGLPKEGLAYKTLARILEPLNIPIIYSAPSQQDVEALPRHALFVVLSKEHYLLGMRGENATLIFDSLGLPEKELAQILGEHIPFLRWNRYGYQSMYSAVCGYYVITVIQEIRRGSMIHTADIDKTLGAICKYTIEIPDTMPEWYRSHRLFSTQLKENDRAVYEFVSTIYPDMTYIDKEAIHEPLSDNALVGSPLFRHAGINPHTVAAKYGLMAGLTNAVDPQRRWPGIGEAVTSIMPQSRLVPSTAPAKTPRQLKHEAEAQRRDIARKHRVRQRQIANTALTNRQQQLEARTQNNNAFNPPAGPGGEAAPGQDPAPPQNLVGDDDDFADANGYVPQQTSRSSVSTAGRIPTSLAKR